MITYTKTLIYPLSTFLLLSLLGCSSQEPSIPHNNDEKIVDVDETISDGKENVDNVDETVPFYPFVLNQKETEQWINDYSGRYVTKENSDFSGSSGFDVIEIYINQPSENAPYNIYQITCCLNDGVVYSIENISKENDFTYSLHLKRGTIDGSPGFQDFTMFPTDTYLIRDIDKNDTEFELQFVGVNNSTLDSFKGEVERGEYFKEYPELYKNADEWYIFTKR